MGPIKALKLDVNTFKERRNTKSPDLKPPLCNTESADMKQRNKVTQDDLLFTPEARLYIKVEPKPFLTLNKMWRPMSMGSISVRDAHSDKVCHSFNNFDVLKGISAWKVGPKGENLLPKATDLAINGNIDRSCVSDDSMALLSARVSEKHCNSIRRILCRIYGLDDFGQAIDDVEQLLLDLKQTMASLRYSGIDLRPKQYNICKYELENQVRQFVSDAKFLVSNATQTKSKLANCLDKAVHTLAKIFLHSQATMLMMETIYQPQHLGFEIIKVANAFNSTINAAHDAVCCQTVGDPHMKYLMRQATNLATLISNLLKSLKSFK